jgi:beta-D-xylosidase 4
MNNFRDPRWGRGQETPGEDAYHVQNYIRNFVPAMQGDDLDNKQIIATCKHYAVYDLETGRYGNNYDPTQQDLADYYLAPFKTCIQEAHVGSVMCAYNSVLGIPSCASEYLLEDVLRGHWNFTKDYNYVTGDCGAVGDIFDYHNFTESYADAAAVALNAGTDTDCGNTYIHLNESLAANSTTIARVDQALTRLYSALFTVGFFNGGKYESIGWSDVGTSEANALAYEAAVAGMSLLKNSNGFLPLDHGKHLKVAVVGPYGNASGQMQGAYSGPPKHIVRPLEAFGGYDLWDVTYEEGTGISSNSTEGFDAAVTAAEDADVVFYLGGLDNSVEMETRDRKTLEWPGNQLDLIEQLADTGKPVVVAQFGGGQVDDSSLLSNKNIKAIVWAGYPSQDGGTALLDVLTGKKSIAGRLPITQYPASYNDEVSIYDINLRSNATYPGRTYQWYTGKAVLPFGYGLHYTTFSQKWTQQLHQSYDIQHLVKKARSSSRTGKIIPDTVPFATVQARVKNTGRRASDYVGLLFLSSKNAGPTPRPIKRLVSYARLHEIPTGGSQALDLKLTLGSLARANENGDFVIYPGKYKLALDVDERISFTFELKGKPEVVESLPRPKDEYKFTVPVTIQPPSYANYAEGS